MNQALTVAGEVQAAEEGAEAAWSLRVSTRSSHLCSHKVVAAEEKGKCTNAAAIQSQPGPPRPHAPGHL